MNNDCIFGKKDSPCKDCKKRYLGCHDICPEYKEDVEKRRRINENRRKWNDRKNFEIASKRRITKK